MGLILEQTISQTFGVNAMVFAMAAIGLNVHFGYTGLLNFGQIGFVALGAYGLGMSSPFGAGTRGWGSWSASLFALIFALLLGIPTLRLRGDYLAIVTIAAAEVLRILVRSTALPDWTGGNTGSPTSPTPSTSSTRSPSAPTTSGLLPYRANLFIVIAIGWPLVLFVLILAVDAEPMGKGGQGDP